MNRLLALSALLAASSCQTTPPLTPPPGMPLDHEHLPTDQEKALTRFTPETGKPALPQ